MSRFPWPFSTKGAERRIDATAAAAPLGALFEKLTRFEVIPHSSKYAGLQYFAVVPPTSGGSFNRVGGGLLVRDIPEQSRYDLIFSRAGTAAWLCCNVGPLFVELTRILSSRPKASKLDPLRLSTLILDFLTTETSNASTIIEATQLAQLMLSMGLGLLPNKTDWPARLKELAVSQAQEPENGPMSTVVRWAVEIETGPARSLTEREHSLDRTIVPSDDVTGLDLNRWAYFLLRLQLFQAAVPLAKRALQTAGMPEHFPARVRKVLRKDDHEFNVAGVRDTLGWGLCFEGRYAEAEALLTQATSGIPRYSNDWFEVNYHLAHALFWGAERNRATEVVHRMESDDAKNLWTQRARELIKTARPGAASAEKRRYDVVLSFAGEDRTQAEVLARRLVEHGLAVFYDDFERSVLWGQDLYEYLTDLYQNRATYCVVLVSKYYANKRWTRLEWRAIQARCFRECDPYCLPVRIDETDLPGLLPTTAYLSIAADGIDAIAEAVVSKLGNRKSN